MGVVLPLQPAAFPMQACLDHQCTWDSSRATCLCPSNYIGDNNPNPVIPGPLNQPPPITGHGP